MGTNRIKRITNYELRMVKLEEPRYAGQALFRESEGFEPPPISVDDEVTTP